MNALRLSALAFVAALFVGGITSTAQAQYQQAVPLVEYEVVVDVRLFLENPYLGRRWSETQSIVVLSSTSHTEASDYAEMMYMTWMIDPDLAEAMISDEIPYHYYLVGFRIEDVRLNTINNWNFGRVSRLR